jgi:hypothetical protein
MPTPQITLAVKETDKLSLFFTTINVLEDLEYEIEYLSGVDTISKEEIKKTVKSTDEEVTISSEYKYSNEVGEAGTMYCRHTNNYNTVSGPGGDYLFYAAFLEDESEITEFEISRSGLDRVEVLFKNMCGSIDPVAGWFHVQNEVPILPSEFVGNPKIFSMLSYYSDGVSEKLSTKVANTDILFNKERINEGWYFRPTGEPSMGGDEKTDQIGQEIGLEYVP